MNERLQRLREALRMEWGELAKHLKMSRAMLDFSRKGQRNLSFKAIRRLEEAERQAGIAPPVVDEKPGAASISVSVAGVEGGQKKERLSDGRVRQTADHRPSTTDPTRDLREIRDELRELLARVEGLLGEGKK